MKKPVKNTKPATSQVTALRRLAEKMAHKKAEITIFFFENNSDNDAAMANASSVCPDGKDESPPSDNFSIKGCVTNGRSRKINAFSP